jgi:hypothetical protein
MRTIITTACAALVVAVAPAALCAQGPVREGLRATGQAAVQGTRGVVQGAGRVVQGAGQAAAQGVRAGAQATGQVLRGTAQGIGAGVRAITPAVPWQAGQGAAVADRGRDARWRMQQHNGEWWYYTPENNWMYHRDGDWNQFSQDSFQAPQSHSTGYRGLDQNPAGQAGQQQAQHDAQQGPAHRVFTDRQGREYICDNGQRVYLDQGQGAQGQGDQGQGEGQQPTPAQPEDPNAQGAADANAQPQGEQSALDQSQPQNEQAQPTAQPQDSSAQPQGQPEQPQQPATTAPSTDAAPPTSASQPTG